MIAKKPTKPRKKTAARSKDWRDALRTHLAKVPEVDAVFARTENGTIHVFSVVEQFFKTNYKRLINRENQIEKAFPEISFEFHAWPHQGRDPRHAGPQNSELVFLR